MRVIDILSQRQNGQFDPFVFDDHFDQDASFFIHFPLIKKISSLRAPPHTSHSPLNGLLVHMIQGFYVLLCRVKVSGKFLHSSHFSPHLIKLHDQVSPHICV